MLPRRHNASLGVKREKERSDLTIARPVYWETISSNEQLVQPVGSLLPTKRDTKVYVKELQLLSLSFFFKQKTAYEILSGLVGSEMCIRDRPSNS